MEASARAYRVAALAGSLAALALVVGQPLLLVGAGAVGAVLLARQWAFYTASTGAVETLSVDLTLSRAYLKQDETTAVTLAVELDAPATVETTVSVPTPLIADRVGDPLSVTLAPGETTATQTTQFRWETAGSSTVGQPTVRLASPDGLFSQGLQRGPTPSVTVEPPAPGAVHVGEGGDRIDASLGEHRTGRFGDGIDPAQIRQYVPGDDVGDIDWKATARQGEPHVREYEVETDRRTVLLFDHRESTAIGQAGEQAVDYLREVALAVALASAEAGDPLALYAVGDEGITTAIEPGTGPEQYRAVQTALQDLEPTTDGGERQRVAQPAGGAGAVQTKADRLAGESSAFASTLRPYLTDTGRYLQRMDSEPLFDTARTRLTRHRGDAQTLIFTTDGDRPQLRETVKLLAGDGSVGVFLAVGGLFAGDAMADLEGTYHDYTNFESFRRDLAGLPQVAAYEVAPGARLDAVMRASQDG